MIENCVVWLLSQQILKTVKVENDGFLPNFGYLQNLRISDFEDSYFYENFSDLKIFIDSLYIKKFH